MEFDSIEKAEKALKHSESPSRIRTALEFIRAKEAERGARAVKVSGGIREKREGEVKHLLGTKD